MINKDYNGLYLFYQDDIQLARACKKVKTLVYNYILIAKVRALYIIIRMMSNYVRTCKKDYTQIIQGK